jgi:hypothetical protein
MFYAISGMACWQNSFHRLVMIKQKVFALRTKEN